MFQTPFQPTIPDKSAVTDPVVYSRGGDKKKNRVIGVGESIKNILHFWMRYWNALITEEILPLVHDSLVLLVSPGLAIAVV